ncbi:MULTISPECIES: Ppx/GppA phosphatase family protein [Bacillus]|uniref:Ppx/GppA phosphatase family protein n=1 Tax=Bacillus TaxID=1386 RepID=UPI0002EAB31A|nr:MULTISPECIES: hypothetical protein [Bacillus]
MIYGVIDIGSNTIRLNIYTCQENNLKSLLSKKTTAGLAGYVKNGIMSEKGISTACEILRDYKSILDNFGIENVYVFATASLRNIINSDEVVRNIQECTGFFIDVISGAEEATLDFIGASNFLNVDSGILVDIGGGSTELAVYENAVLKSATSIPIGSLSMFTKHVSKLIPKKEERLAMKEDILMELAKLGSNNQTHKVICGVGGTVRATKKIYHDLHELDSSNDLQVNYIKDMLALFKKADKSTLRRILRVVPDRIHTIIPGMIILDTIAEYYGSEIIHISGYGVREGYLYSKVLKEGEEHEQG